MKSIIDLSHFALMQGFNFISRVCSAELGETTIPSTDRIRTSTNDENTFYIWERMKKDLAGVNLRDMDKERHITFPENFDRCYRTFLEDRSYNGDTARDCIDFRIYVTDNCDNPCIFTFSSERILKDSCAMMSVSLPNLKKPRTIGDETLTDRQFFMIKSIFRYLLRGNYEGNTGIGLYIQDEARIKSIKNGIVSFINNLSIAFAVCTGLFPEGYKPPKVSDDIIQIAEDMISDSRLITSSNRGFMSLSNNDILLEKYFDDLIISTTNADGS